MHMNDALDNPRRQSIRDDDSSLVPETRCPYTILALALWYCRLQRNEFASDGGYRRIVVPRLDGVAKELMLLVGDEGTHGKLERGVIIAALDITQRYELGVGIFSRVEPYSIHLVARELERQSYLDVRRAVLLR